MRMSQAFPTKYLSAADLQGKSFVLTVKNVTVEEMERGGDRKPVVWFQESPKGLALNKINSNMIVEAYGDESDAWSGQKIEVYPSETEFQGKIVPCIRVRTPQTAPPPVPSMVANVPSNEPPPIPGSVPLDDDIPF